MPVITDEPTTETRTIYLEPYNEAEDQTQTVEVELLKKCGKCNEIQLGTQCCPKCGVMFYPF